MWTSFTVVWLVWLCSLAAVVCQMARCVPSTPSFTDVGPDIQICDRRKRGKGGPQAGNRGGWTLSSNKCYYLDVGLAVNISQRIKGSSLADIGAGLGCYTNFFRYKNITVTDSFDFAENIDKITMGNVKRWDATIPYNFSKQPDWIFSVEVAEHVPPDGNEGLMTNLIHSRCGTIVSWAKRHQSGAGHINCKDKEEVVELFKKHNFHENEMYRKLLQPDLPWTKQNLLIFEKYPVESTCKWTE